MGSLTLWVPYGFLLYPKHAALRNAQPAPVLELGHELKGMPQMNQNGIYFLSGENRRDVIRRFCTGDVIMSSKILVQDVPV